MAVPVSIGEDWRSCVDYDDEDEMAVIRNEQNLFIAQIPSGERLEFVALRRFIQITSKWICGMLRKYGET